MAPRPEALSKYLCYLKAYYDSIASKAVKSREENHLVTGLEWEMGALLSLASVFWN